VKKFIKRIFKPISYIFTKLFFDIDLIKPHIKKVFWEESNAFKWSSSYVVKNQIEGDYLEFGVWKGNSFIEMYRQMKITSESFYLNNKKKKISNIKNIFERMKFHAFDSFEGLPETSLDKPIQYFKGNYSADENIFLNNLRQNGVDLNKVTTTKGWFDKSLNTECVKKIDLKKIAIAYIDCDLYESTVPILNFITPFLKTGTVLIFDDWFRNGGYINNGVQGAVLDWLNKNQNIILQHYHNSDTRTATFIVRASDTEINNTNRIDCV
jgi:O-methyltransferase